MDGAECVYSSLPAGRICLGDKQRLVQVSSNTAQQQRQRTADATTSRHTQQALWTSEAVRNDGDGRARWLRWWWWWWSATRDVTSLHNRSTR